MTDAQQPQRELPIYYERLLQSVRYVVLKSHVTYPEYIAGTSNNRRDSIKFMEWLMKENPTAKVRAIGLDEYILESKPFEPRPHTPSPEVIAYPLTDVDIEELSDYANAEDAEACIRSLCERIKKRPTDTAFGYVNICNQDKCIKQRDQIARAATLAETQRIYGLFHEVEMLHLNGMAYPDLYNEMVARIKFIHTEPLSKEGRKKPKQSTTAAQEARR
jgi:hypothetical protein